MPKERLRPDAPESTFSHRMGRLLDRFADWRRYVRHPQGLFHKYLAQRQAVLIMRRPEVRAALEVAFEESERNDLETRKKYTNIERYIAINLRRIYALGLHACPPLSVLDIGAGAGFFLYLCTLYGHEATGFDVDQGDFYRKMHAALDVSCQCHSVLPGTPLPGFGKKFEVITSFAVCFHKLPDRTWSKEEWRFFCADLLGHHCKDGGRVHLHLNDSPRGDRRDVREKITAFFPAAAHSYHSVELFKSPAMAGNGRQKFFSGAKSRNAC